MQRTAIWLGILLLGFAGCGGPSGDGQGGPTNGNGKSKQDPVQLKVLDFDQIMALIKGHKGKVVVVDFWATS